MHVTRHDHATPATHSNHRRQDRSILTIRAPQQGYFSLLLIAFVALAPGCSDATSSAQTDQTSSRKKPDGPDSPRSSSGKPSTPPGKRGARGKSRPALVELATVSDGSLTDGWTFLGRVQPALSTEMATAVAGHVLSVKAREGDRVPANKALVTLDSAKIRAELAASKAKEQGISAELEFARKQVERSNNIDYKAAISVPEHERITLAAAKLDAQLASQRAETRRLQVDYQRHSLKAPFAGVVSMRHVDPGAWVSMGTPVLALVSLEDLEIHVDVSADLRGRIQVGQTAHLLGKTKASAQIAGIVDVLDPSTRTMRVRLLPTQHPPWLIAGMAVDVEFAVTLDDTTLGKAALLVSRDALVRGPVRTRVIKYEDGSAVPIYVAVLATVKDQALVFPEPDEPPLAIGDQVVVRGNERLRPGQSLRVAP